mgnify:CR=1 FL=1
MSTILSLDIALANTGVAVYEYVSNEQDFDIVPTEGFMFSSKAIPKKLPKGSYRAFESLGRYAEYFSKLLQTFMEYSPKLVFAEISSASQSATASAALAAANASLGAVTQIFDRVEYVWVSQNQVKKAILSDGKASKKEIINAAFQAAPKLFENYLSNRKTDKGEPLAKSEHIADAYAVYLAGINTLSEKEIRAIMET